MVHVGFFGKIDTWLRTHHGNLRRIIRRGFWEGTESLAQAALHLLGIEIADDAKDDVVRSEMPRVPIEQVLPRDSCHRPILDLASIRTIFAIAELCSLAVGDAVDFVIAARNRRLEPSLRQRDFLFKKNWMLEHIKIIGKHLIEVLLQAIEIDGCGIHSSAGFDFGSN